MKMLGKSMNTVEKPTKTMDKTNEQCKWQILAPKFNKVEVFASNSSKQQRKVPQTEKKRNNTPKETSPINK